MGFINESYKLILVLLVSCTYSLLFSQSNTCEIIAPVEPERISATRLAGNVTQSQIGLEDVEWIDLDNHRVSDDKHVSVTLGAAEHSYQLKFNDFNFNVPDGAVINGISLMVEGHSRGTGVLKDVQVQLLSGDAVGKDKANFPIKGLNWVEGNSDGTWQYGVTSSLWDFDWTYDIINSADFGCVIQIENAGWGDHTAYIDQVKIVVNYTPLYDLCLHDCTLFFIEPIEGVTEYDWDIPNEFEYIYSDDNQHIANLNFPDSIPGHYTICVTPQGHDQCCRDFVYNDCSKGSLGDYVWMDNNANGIQNNSELPLEGVTVFLFNESGQHIGTSVTDSVGFYLFEDLCAGNYQLELLPIDPKYVPTISGGGNENNDSNFDLGYGPMASGIIPLKAGEHIRNVDFGIVPPSKVEGTVWKDANGDGNQSGDSGLANISLSIFDCEGTKMETTTTNDDGYYIFKCVYMGSYYLMVDQPEDHMAVFINQSEFTDNNGDNTTDCFEVLMNNTTTVNVAFKPLLDVGDYVWEDVNKNGVQDGNESGIEGIDLDLYNDADSLITSTTTASDGSYSFIDLIPDSYYIKVTNFEGWVAAQPNSEDDTTDSDGITTDGMVVSHTFSLTECNDDFTIDFGFCQPTGCVDGYVWKDANSNGFDDDENGQEGVDVTLFSCDSIFIVETRTDETGYYEFCEIPAGSYFIEFWETPEYLYYIGNDSDVTNTNGAGSTDCFDIIGGETVSSNAGILLLADLGDSIWEDSNKNGLQDDGEPGIGGVSVTLYQGNNVVTSTISEADGSYRFTDIPPGSYTIQVSNFGDYVAAANNAGNDLALDSDGVPSENIVTSGTIDFYECEDNFTIDFGFCVPTIPTGCISGIVWKNCNADLINENEEGMPGVNVSVLTCGGTFTHAVVTDENGFYEFCDLPPGSYYVEFLETTEYVILTGGDSDVTNELGQGSTDCEDVLEGETITLNGEVVILADIGNYVWNDNNKNGIQDNDEAGISGINLSLYDADATLVQSVTSNANGEYLFENVSPGNYYIEATGFDGFVAATNDAGSDDQLDSDGIMVNNILTTEIFSFFDCGDNLSIDFGFCAPIISVGCVEGTVWKDANGNGLNDNEDGMSGINISIFNCDSIFIQTVVSDPLGYYQFCDIEVGSYFIEFWETPEYAYTVGNESDVTHTNGPGSTDCFAISENTTHVQNAGLIVLMTVGDFVWEDVNKNGIQDNGEPGIEGINLTLYDQAGNLVNTTSTNANGNYSFEDLRPNTYYIQITNFSGYDLAPNNSGNFNQDSNGSLVDGTVVSEDFSLFDCEDNLSIDFGFCVPPIVNGCIQGTVWKDANGNGFIDNESGVLGATVTLYNCESIAIITTTTNNDGFYQFCDLEPANYYVQFTETDTYQFIIGNDSNVSHTYGLGSTECVTVGGGETIVLNGSAIFWMNIGDFVWNDTNKNGIQDPGEPGIPGVTLTLVDQNGTTIETVITNGDGNYVFQDHDPGTYYILVTNFGDFDIAPPNIGDNEDTDSDAIYDGSNVISHTFTLNDCENITNIDFGFCLPVEPTGCVQGNVFKDSNGDAFSEGESPFSGVEISLYTCDGVVVQTILSDENGNYKFNEVPPGSYYVEFWESSEYLFLIGNDSDVTHSNGRGSTDCFTIANGNIIILDGALAALMTLGDLVWEDINKNGLQDDGEPGISGIIIALYHSNGTFINSVVSNVDGLYSISNVLPGEYYLQIDFFEGYNIAAPNTGDNNSLDSDGIVSGQNVITENFTMYECADNLNLDFGFCIPPSDERDDCLNGIVWSDEDANGFIGEEPGVGEVNVYLNDCEGNILQSTITDENGYYEFCPMPIGEFYILFDCHQEYSYILENESDVTNNNGVGSTDCFTLDDQDNYIINGGLAPLSTIGDYVWNDENKNGLQDENEVGIAGIIIELYTEEGQFISSVATNEFGKYWIGNIGPGNYYTQISNFDGWNPSPNGQGDSKEDSNGRLVENTVRSEILSLNDGKYNNSIDFGFCVQEAIDPEVAGRVWRDNDGDAFIGEDPGLNQLNISLFTCDGTLVETATSSASGSFNFTELENGTYYLSIDAIEDFEFVVGGDSHFIADGKTECFEANQGDLVTINLGLWPLSDVGDEVWNDENKDGIFQDTEVGLAGFTLNIYDNNNVLLATTISNDSGKYLFRGLRPNNYKIEAIPPTDNFELTLQNMGDDELNDSDGEMQDGVATMLDVVLNNGVSLYFYDFGFYVKDITIGEIAGTLWSDGDGDSLFQGDLGISEVEVSLYTCEGTLVESQTTAADGLYSFTEIENGEYYLGIDPMEEHEFVTGGDSGFTSAWQSDCFSIVQGEIFTLNLGVWPLSDVGDEVWNDENKDGIFQDTEVGLPGFTLNIYNQNGELLNTTISNDLGKYIFRDLRPGDYIIEAITPSDNYELTLQDIGDDELNDSDGEMQDGIPKMLDVILRNGVSLFFYDFGFYEKEIEHIYDGSMIGDQIWVDSNRDGIYTEDEPGMANVSITLYNEENQLMETITTDANGIYSFDDLDPGVYSLTVEIQEGFNLTNTFVGDRFTDSNGVKDGNNVIVAVSIEKDGTEDTSYDVGFVTMEEEVEGSLSGAFFRDMDDDGLNNDGGGIGNVNIQLFTCDGEFVQAVNTNGNGAFNFENIDQGEFYIEFPAFENSVFQTVGTSSIEESTEGLTECFIYDGATAVVINGGIVPLARIGDFVWEDLNENGIQDDNEPGIAGIELNIIAQNGSITETTITNEEGKYMFRDLRPGIYNIYAIDIDGYELTFQDAEDDDSIDSDALIEDGSPMIRNIAVAGANSFRFDFGLIRTDDVTEGETAIIGFVFEDMDGNGIFEDSEFKIGDIEVNLLNDDGDIIESTNTDSDGYYAFRDFTPGNYFVEFILSSNIFPTEAEVGNDPTLDSDVRMQDGFILAGIFEVSAGDTITGINAGYYHPITIGDYIWYDNNSNGLQDDNENGVNDFLIRLFDENGNQVEFTTSKLNPETNKSGYYVFENIAPGSYYVNASLSFGTEFSEAFVGSDHELDSNIDNSNGPGTTPTVALESGDESLSVDIGLLSTPGLVGDRVWIDENGNGIQDDGEIGFNGANITLYDVEGTEIDQTTSVDSELGEPGYFAFEGVPTGDYYLVFELPDGYLPTIQFQGGNASFDSDVTSLITDGATNIFSVSSGLFLNDIDCGIFLPGSIGDYVWRDNNNNGLQQFGEFGVSNVRVNLYREEEGFASSTTTDNQGRYEFVGIRPGVYFIQVEMPNNLMFTSSLQGLDDSKDSNVDMTGVSELIEVNQSTTILNIDAGLINATAMVSGRTWLDTNNNGLRDFNEPNLDNIDIGLYDSDDELVKETTSNVLGMYSFPFVDPGNYTVQFALPDGLSFTLQDAQGSDNEDSDPNEMGRTGIIVVEVDNQVENVDAGYSEQNIVSEGENQVLYLTGSHDEEMNMLSWIDENYINGDQYRIWKSVNNQPYEILKTIQPSNMGDLQYPDYHNKVFGEYTYRIEKIISNHESTTSNTWAHMYESTVHDVKFYPVPAKDYIIANFKKEKESDVVFVIMDETGNKIKEYTYLNVPAGYHEITIPLEGIKIGKYVIQAKLGIVMYSEIIMKVD